MSDSDDLGEELLDNLQLRRELKDEIANATDSVSQRVSRSFHRIGVFLAMFVLAVGLALIISDVVRLMLWDTRLDELPMVLGGLVVGLIILGLACLAIYGLVRAIGWVVGGFMAS